MKKLLLFFLALCFSPNVFAGTVTVDFEEFNVGDGGGSFGVGMVTSEGFVFSGGGGPPGAPVITDPASIGMLSNGSKAFGASIGGIGQDDFGPRVFISISREDGGAFGILSADFSLSATGPGEQTTISGTLAGGGVADLSGAIGTGDWLNLEQLSLYAETGGFGGTAGITVDNVVASVVPIPAAVWLFGSGLFLLGWVRRGVRPRT